MSSETYHEARELLGDDTQELHRALSSLREELEAIDWYRQRIDASKDEELRGLLAHNMREEIEHSCMLLEWLRRHNEDFAEMIDTYLYTKGDLLEAEEQAEKKEKQDCAGEQTGEADEECIDTCEEEIESENPAPSRLTIGSLKEAS